jgi:hypothetical protein
MGGCDDIHEAHLRTPLRRAAGAEPCGTVSLIRSTNQPAADRHGRQKKSSGVTGEHGDLPCVKATTATIAEA